jgi:hypothetical protein
VTTQLSGFSPFNNGGFVTYRADITQRRVQPSTVRAFKGVGVRIIVIESESLWQIYFSKPKTQTEKSPD